MQRGVFMELQAFRDYEVDKIYKNKLIYSIIKYDEQNNDFKEFYHEKYCNALSFSNSSFYNSAMVEVKEYLDKAMIKYNEVIKENQEVIDLVSDQLVRNLANEAYKLPNDLEKCRFLFEYVSRIMNYDYDTKKYNRFIPFGEDYPFEFYNGVPISSSYKGLLVTKTGLSDSISNLMIFLGYKLGLNISSITCQNHNGSYVINTIKIDDNISYLDITSVIKKKCRIEDACLVDRATLLKNNNYTGIIEEGILIPLDYSKPYNLNKLIKAEEKIIPTARFIENDIFTKEKTS